MERPIGYWLKHLHDLLETHFEVTLADLGVGRRHWQVLTALSRGSRTRDDLREALAPFWEVDPDLGEVLDALVANGWVAEGGGTVSLSDRGRAEHARIATRIDGTRAALLGDLTSDQYADTVRALSVMAANVQADLAGRTRLTLHGSPGALLSFTSPVSNGRSRRAARATYRPS